MKKSIDDELRTARAIAEFTGELPDSRLVNAFRAREFRLCPMCDKPALTRIDKKWTIKINCDSCQSDATIESYEIANSKEGFYFDDALILLVVDKMQRKAL